MTYAELTDAIMAAVKYSIMTAEIMFTDGTKKFTAEEMALKKIHRHWDENGKLIVELELVNVTQPPEPIESGEEDARAAEDKRQAESAQSLTPNP